MLLAKISNLTWYDERVVWKGVLMLHRDWTGQGKVLTIVTVRTVRTAVTQVTI